MKKSKILTAIALTISLSAFTGVASSASHMEGYDNSVEYSEYRDTTSSYTLRTSEIIGADIENPAGESVGEVDDLVVSREDKLMAVVSVGGFLGVGDRLVVVPYEQLRMGKEAEKVFLDVDKVALEAMPEFEYDDGEVMGYKAMAARQQATNDTAKPTEKMGYDKSVEYTKFRSEDSAYKLRVSDVLGETIENADGDNIGEIDDLVIPRDDKGLQAVVSVGGFLGMGDKLISMPYQELRVSSDGDELYLAATEASLKAKPAFAYNEGEKTGMMMLKERKRYVADVKEDLAETMSDAKVAAAAAVKQVDESVSVFKDSVTYTEARNADSTYHLRMSEVIGEDVKNANNEDIGQIDDLIMSRKDDHLMAIISVGGFLGMGDKLVSVPYNELRISKDGGDIYIDTTKEKLEARAEFKYNDGESFGQTRMQQKMDPETEVKPKPEMAK